LNVPKGQKRSSARVPTLSLSDQIERSQFSLAKGSSVHYEEKSISKAMNNNGRIFQAGELLGHYGNGLKGKSNHFNTIY